MIYSFIALFISLVFTAIYLIINVRHINKKQVFKLSWLAALAAVSWASFAFTINGLLFISFAVGVYFFWALNIRWNTWLQYDNKMIRLAVYAACDLVLLAVSLLNWYLTQGSWVFYLSAPIVITLLQIGILALLQLFHPVTLLQEKLYLSAANSPAYKTIRRQIALHRYVQNQKRITLAEEILVKGNYVSGALDAVALELYTIAEELEDIGAADLVNEQKLMLGESYRLLASIYLFLNDLTKSAQYVILARRFIKPGIDLMGPLAEAAADGRDLPEGNSLCLDYLALRREVPFSGRTKKISYFLERQCVLNEKASPEQIAKARQIAKKALEADLKLAWPHRVFGHCFTLTQEWQFASGPLETSYRLEPRDSATLLLLGLTYIKLKRSAQAFPLLKESLKLNRNQSLASYYVGHMLFNGFKIQKPLTGTVEEDLKQSIEYLENAARLDGNNASYQYELAVAYRSNHQGEKAAQALAAAIKLKPDHGDSHKLMGDICYENQQYAEAAPHYRAVYTQKNSDPTLILNYSHCLIETRQDSEALILLEIVKGEPFALYLTGRARLHFKQFGEAVKCLEQYILDAGDKPEALYYLACAQAWLGQSGAADMFTKSAALFNKLIPVPAFSAKASLQLGHISLIGRDYQTAGQNYSQARKDKTCELAASLGLARTCLGRDQVAEALEALVSLENSHPQDKDLNSLLGLIYEMQGNLKKAENAYQNAGNKSALGVIYYLEGQKTKALSLIQEARSNGDNSDRLLYYSGLIYADQKEYSQAISEWEGLKRRHPEDGTIQNNISNAWFLIGWDAYQSGNLSQAVKAMENYFSSHADDEAFKLTLGQLYIQLAVNSLGSEASQDAVQRARELKFSEPTCAYIEALNALKSGNIEKGLEILKRLHQNEPDNPIISFNLGMAHIGRDQPDQAISYLQQTHKNGEAELKRLSSWALVSAHVKLGEWQEAASMIKSI